MGAKVSIIIPVWNAAEMTSYCLPRLFHTIRERKDVEVIVIDNGSEDYTVELLKTWKDIGLINILISNPSNLGFPKAVNQGFEVATGDYICVMNNDVYASDGWLDKLQGYLDQNRGDIVGPCFNHPTSGYLPLFYRNLMEFNIQAEKAAERYKNQIKPIPFLIFSCVLIKREVIDGLGYFMDEQFTPGNFEDNDFCTRAIRRGFLPIVARDVFVHHFKHTTHIANKVPINALMAKNMIMYEKKWGMSAKAVDAMNHNLVMKTAKQRFADKQVTVCGGM